MPAAPLMPDMRRDGWPPPGPSARPTASPHTSPGVTDDSRIIIWIASLITALTAAAKGEDGIASHYDRSSGSKVACGGELNEFALTAAHKTLPCGTRVRVENKQNGRAVTVTINDRGPYIASRIIDLTPAGASALGFSGLARVSLLCGSSGWSCLQPSRRWAVPLHEVGKIEPPDPALLHHPLSPDHDPIRLVRAAQDERGQRITGTEEAKFVQLVECEIGDLAGLNYCRAPGWPMQAAEPLVAQRNASR